MEKTYKITDKKMSEAQGVIITNGGKISPDGSFEISGVKGRYKKNGDSVTVTITDKPWLATWDMIETKLDEFFN